MILGVLRASLWLIPLLGLGLGPTLPPLPLSGLLLLLLLGPETDVSEASVSSPFIHPWVWPSDALIQPSEGQE